MDPDAPEPPPPLPEGHPGASPLRRFNPWVFFGFLLGPAVLTVVSILVLPNDAAMGAGMIFAIAGSLIGGIVGGTHFARCQTRLTTGAKVGVGFAMAIGCAGVAFALSFGGCLLGAGLTDGFH